MKLLLENWRKYLLIERYSIEDGMEAIKPTNKKMRKVYKRYNNQTWHWEVERGWIDPKEEPPPAVPEEKINKAAYGYRTYIFEVIPQDIGRRYSDGRTVPENKRKEVADQNQGLAVMWIRKLSIKDPKLARDIIDGEITYSGRGHGDTPYSDIMPDLEIYFQNLDLMPKRNLIELESFDELHQMVEEAKEEIYARQEKKQYLDAEEGTKILSGKMVPNEETGKLERSPGKNGWFIAEIHNKGAACELGKGTDWCTATDLDFFDEYYEPDDPLFFFEGFWTDPSTRFQFHYGSESFMDAGDRPVNKETFKTLHSLLMQTEAPEKYQVVQDKQYEIIAGDSDTPAEELNKIIELYLQRRSSGWGSNIIEKVAKNAKTPLESLKKLYHSTDNKYITRSIQVNPVIDFALAKEILMSNPKDELIYARGIKQMTGYKRWGISFEEVNKIINAVEAARNYEPRQIPQEVANLYEHKLKIRIRR
jgi:hypothetical protein